jgi:hypothetical protein
MSVDAETYAGWGIDSLKMDGGNSRGRWIHSDGPLSILSY